MAQREGTDVPPLVPRILTLSPLNSGSMHQSLCAKAFKHEYSVTARPVSFLLVVLNRQQDNLLAHENEKNGQQRRESSKKWSHSTTVWSEGGETSLFPRYSIQSIKYRRRKGVFSFFKCYSYGSEENIHRDKAL